MGTLIIRFFQIAVYFMVCAHLWFYRKNSLDYSLLVQYFLLIYFAFFWTILISSTHQFIWVMPFMMFYVNSKKKWEKVFYLVIAIIFLGGLESREAFFGLFAPLNPKLFMSLPSLQDFTGYIFDQDLYKQTIESFYFGVTAIWSFSIFKNLFYPFRKPFSIN